MSEDNGKRMNSEEVSVEKLSDSAFYRMYVDEVRVKTTVRKEAELQALYRRLLGGEDAAAAEVMDAWLMQILEMAKFYKEEPVLMEDVVQEGNIGLWTALKNLPEDLKAEEMEAFLVERVKTSMEDYIRETTGEMDKAQSVVGKAALLYSAREQLAKENGVVPSNRELSGYTHIPVEEIRDIFAIMKGQEA